MKKVIITIAAFGLILMYGCAAFQNALTPCFIEPAAIDYADANATSFMPYTTLWDAERIDRKIDYQYELKQRRFERMAEDNGIEYSYLKNAGQYHRQGAKEFQQTFFSPTGPVGMLLPTLFGGTLGALLIPRPGDKKREEKT